MTADPTRPFRTLAVVGAGNMGSGIAQKMATEGFDVVLVDVDDGKVARGIETIARTLAEGVSRRVFTPAQANAARARLRGTTAFEDLADAELVVEAVFEDRGVKREVFGRLDACCRPDAILATNTSSFAVSEIAGATRRPERVLGLHYFYHPAKNRLVEVVPGTSTSADAVARAWMLQERLGKTPIASRDASGFIVNRFFVPWLMEAVRLLGEGVASAATIDHVAKAAFGIGMGPFELMNVTGVPIALHAATTLGQAFGPLYAPPEQLAHQVASGQPWSIGNNLETSPAPQVADRLIGIACYVAAALVDEGVGTIEDTDIGARVGLRWRQGPFELMNTLGVERAADFVSRVAGRWRVPVPERVQRQVAARRPFRFALVRTTTRDGIRTITVNRPDALNALNEAVVAQLRDAVHDAAAAPDVRGIVIAGAGKAFIAGADIRFFVQHIEAGTIDRIVTFTRDGHELLREIERCSKPVVARLHGLALGGGLELALACHAIVAVPKAMMAFPETGIGIYPGLGGTQRTPRRIGAGLARWLIFSGQTIGAAEALAIGLVDRVVEPAELDVAVRALIDAGTVRKTAAPPESHRALADVFARETVDTLRAGAVDAPDERVAKAVKRVQSKAPVALRLAAALIDLAPATTLEDGLAAELDHLPAIFATRDAYTGLQSVGGPPPAFEGR